VHHFSGEARDTNSILEKNELFVEADYEQLGFYLSTHAYDQFSLDLIFKTNSSCNINK
jgi:hypothetical protein